MKANPKIVINTSGKKKSEKDFTFKEEQIRLVPKSEKINRFRKKAFELYESLPLPDTKQEAWRRTDLRALKPNEFQMIISNGSKSLNGSGNFEKAVETGFSGSIHISPSSVTLHHDPELDENGVIFTDLRTAEEKYTNHLEKAIGSIVKPEEGKFAALAAAFAQNGVFLYVPENVIVEKPLRSLITAGGENAALITHIVIYLDKGASATFFHEFASNQEDSRKFHAGIIETHISQDASLKFVEIQAWDQGVWNFTHERIRVENSGNLDWIIGALGSELTKSFMDLDLVGSGAAAKVSGFSFTNNNQHLDYDTQQNHLVPDTVSDLIFKVALTDSSRSVWQGMIYVAPGADKTDGYQSNKNLVLSPRARADSIPGLEILADDVRCTHGATIGDLEYDQVFYMMTRGIPQNLAEKLLVEGFFDPIMQRIPFEYVRERFMKFINQKLNLT